MDFLLRSACVVATDSAFHGKKRDIHIINGSIAEIGESLGVSPETVIIESPDLCVSVGWCDLRGHATDPGYESKEDLFSLQKAAIQGGFTEVVLLPNSHPVVQTKESVRYISSHSGHSPVKLLATAALTLDTAGKDFTEMLDLHAAGAVAFTDGAKPLMNADLLLKALQYLAQINAVVIQRPEDFTLAIHGQMHEGFVNTHLGLRGITGMAEEIIVVRDLRLLEYAIETFGLSPKLHFSLLSSAKSIALVRAAKAAGLPVSCDIAAHYLVFTDENLVNFDTNLKVSPPFRSTSDQEAIRQGLADGTIDAVVSDHCPHDPEAKDVAFDMAECGISSIETTFSTMLEFSGLAIEQIIPLFTQKPRMILGIRQPTIAVGEPAQLTVFDPSLSWKVGENWQSKSKNTPFWGREMRGKVLGIFNQEQSSWS